MYEHDHSASRGVMTVREPVIIFKHVGTDSDLEQRSQQAKLGCAPAHRLFDLLEVRKKDGVSAPRSFSDYRISFKASSVPPGVKVGFASVGSNGVDIAWDSPASCCPEMEVH